MSNEPQPYDPQLPQAPEHMPHDPMTPPPPSHMPPPSPQMPPHYGQMPPQHGQMPPQPMVPLQPIQMVPEHPRAQVVLVLSIVGLFFSVFVVGLLSYIAWYLGAQARKEIEQGAPYLWGGSLQAGYWIAKISSIILIVSTVGSLAFIVCVPLGMMGFLGVAGAGG